MGIPLLIRKRWLLLKIYLEIVKVKEKTYNGLILLKMKSDFHFF